MEKWLKDEILNNTDLLVDLLIYDEISSKVEFEPIEEFLDDFENLSLQEQISFDGSKINITHEFYLPQENISVTREQLVEFQNMKTIENELEYLNQSDLLTHFVFAGQAKRVINNIFAFDDSNKDLFLELSNKHPHELNQLMKEFHYFKN